MSDKFLGTHRLFIVALSGGFFAVIAWAFLAEIDIVVSAQGKLTPVSFVRIAQPAEGGVIREVRVRDGQAVQAGDVLVELDPLYASEDARSSDGLAERLRLQLARIDAELAGTPFLPNSTDAELNTAVLGEYAMRRQAFASALAESLTPQFKAESSSPG